MATKGSLLACPSTGVFLELVGDLLKLCGGYLIQDMLMEVLRRSGKNFPTTYEERHDIHKKCAADPTSAAADSSDLYPEFPSKQSTFVKAGLESGQISWTGFWEDLKFLCAIGFDKDKPHNSLQDTTGGGTFKWNQETMKALESRPKLGTTTGDKQLNMIAYGIELVYDLMLDPANNLSKQPGFEAAGLVNPKPKNN